MFCVIAYNPNRNYLWKKDTNEIIECKSKWNQRNTNEKKTVFGPYIVDIDIHATRTHTHNQRIHYAKNQRYLDTHTQTHTHTESKAMPYSLYACAIARDVTITNTTESHTQTLAPRWVYTEYTRAKGCTRTEQDTLVLMYTCILWCQNNRKKTSQFTFWFFS